MQEKSSRETCSPCTQVCICYRSSISKPRSVSCSGCHRGRAPALRLLACAYCGSHTGSGSVKLPPGTSVWLQRKVVSWLRSSHNDWHMADTAKYPLNWGFPGGSDGEESTCNAGDLGSIPGLERSPGGHGNPLQYCLENPHGRSNLAGYSPWGCRAEHD